MELPTPREIDLETSLRERDTQLAELTDELTRLRQYLVVQPGPSLTDPISLPPALLSVLLPHINKSNSNQHHGSAGSTVTAALTQRARLLQEENDELYELLKTGETGKLKEEVRGLRRVVDRLQSALKESQQVITAMSTELDASYQSLLDAKKVRAPTYSNPSLSPSHSPMSRTHTLPPTSHNGSSKLPPTGPRAHKKPRLSEAHTSPGRSNASLPPQGRSRHDRGEPKERPRERSRSASNRRRGDERGGNTTTQMDVDGDLNAGSRSFDRPRERERERDRDRGADRERDRLRDRDRDRVRERVPEKDRERDRDRDRERDHDRDRDRDRDRSSRRNGSGNQVSGASSNRGGRRGGRGDALRPSNHPSSSAANDGDRTLAERMGL